MILKTKAVTFGNRIHEFQQVTSDYQRFKHLSVVLTNRLFEDVWWQTQQSPQSQRARWLQGRNVVPATPRPRGLELPTLCASVSPSLRWEQMTSTSQISVHFECVRAHHAIAKVPGTDYALRERQDRVTLTASARKFFVGTKSLHFVMGHKTETALTQTTDLETLNSGS